MTTNKFQLLYNLLDILLENYLIELGGIKTVQVNLKYNDKNSALPCKLAYLPEVDGEKPCLLLLDSRNAKGVPEENTSVQLIILNQPPIAGQYVDELFSVGSIHAKCTSFMSVGGGTSFESKVDVVPVGCSMRLSFKGSSASNKHFFKLGEKAQILFDNSDYKWMNKYFRSGSVATPLEVRGVECPQY